MWGWGQGQRGVPDGVTALAPGPCRESGSQGSVKHEPYGPSEVWCVGGGVCRDAPNLTKHDRATPNSTPQCDAGPGIGGTPRSLEIPSTRTRLYPHLTVRIRCATSVRHVRRDQQELDPTNSDMERSWFLLSCSCDSSGYY